MIKFLDGDHINAKMIELIREADDYLTLISPYISLNPKIKAELKDLIARKSGIPITIVFGKNGNKEHGSLSKSDRGFLEDLPNITLGYLEELHAKIYCSEDRIIITSMNLYGYSQANNFEAAFMIEERKGIISRFRDKEAKVAWDDAMAFVKKIIQRSMVLHTGDEKQEYQVIKTSSIIDSSYNRKTLKRPSQLINNTSVGYCIRTGVEIPFNISRPFSEDAYRSWIKSNDRNSKENYCHFSGEKSNGATAHKTPILKKNWFKAKARIKPDSEI